VPETTSHALTPRPGPNGMEPAAPQPFPAPAPPGRPEIAKALAAAQQKCRAVAHDAYNQFHKYAYTSSEAVIGEAKDALAGSGLALVPVEQTVNGSAKDGEDRYELERRFLLIHPSGEVLPLMSRWPIYVEKGRPLDKATAIAATLSLAYLLRDLLLMPRVDAEDEAGARDDRKAGPARAAAPKQTPGPKAAPRDGAELADRLAGWEKTLVAGGLCAAGDLLSHVRNAGVTLGRGSDLAAWDPPAAAAGWQAAAEFDLTRRRRALNDARLAAKREWPEVMAALKLDRATKSDALTRRQMHEALWMLREEVQPRPST
jgi:hypothetical protein